MKLIIQIFDPITGAFDLLVEQFVNNLIFVVLSLEGLEYLPFAFLYFRLEKRIPRLL